MNPFDLSYTKEDFDRALDAFEPHLKAGLSEAADRLVKVDTMDFGDWQGTEGEAVDDIGYEDDVEMTAREIADAVLTQPPTTPDRFDKLARLVVTQAKLQAVVELLPYDMRAGIVAGMRGKVK